MQVYLKRLIERQTISPAILRLQGLLSGYKGTTPLQTVFILATAFGQAYALILPVL